MKMKLRSAKMKNRVIILIMFFLFISGNSLFSSGEGEKSPAMIMKATNGDVFNPAKDGKKKPLILSFFSHNCLPCMNEIPELQAMADKSFDIYLVADSATGENETAEFFKKIKKSSGRDITLPVIYDTYSDMMKRFKVKGFPVFLVIDKNGIINLRFDGYKAENMEILKKRFK